MLNTLQASLEPRILVPGPHYTEKTRSPRSQSLELALTQSEMGLELRSKALAFSGHTISGDF